MPLYDVGDPVRLRARFKDSSDIYTDPTTVTAEVTSPSGVTTAYALPPIVNDAALVGGFYLDITASEEGLWVYQFTGTGAVVAQDEETFRVRPSVLGASRPPCQPWVDVSTIADCCTVTDLDTLEVWAQVATDVLYVLSGRQFTGACTKTIRPCQVTCGCSCHSYGYPGLWSGDWYSSISPSGPRCSAPSVDLGGGAASVTSVTVDGETLASSAYRLDEGRWLVRMANEDGSNEGWPCCQRIDLPATEECTFEIAYVTAADVPELGVRAAADLACEMAKACSPATAGECRLPKRVTNLTRQGVTMTLLDPQDFLDQGRTGLYLADLFLRTVNPQGLRSPPRVLSPDVEPPRRIG